jgi:hypothetical protein
MSEVIVGTLRAIQEDRWKCKVPSFTEDFHCLKDCKVFGGMEPEERMRLMERHKLCLGCLTPGHSRAAQSCPYKEEQVDACNKLACKASHHYLLNLDRTQVKANRKGRPPDERSTVASDAGGQAGVCGAVGCAKG